MDSSGEIAERLIRISIDGTIYTARITGASSKYLAEILRSTIKEENKTKGVMRLSNMIRQDKELKVFTLTEEQYKSFKKEVKRFGVTYCVLKDKDNTENHPLEIMAKAEDASKIGRIFEKLNFAKVDTSKVEADIEKAPKENTAQTEIKEKEQEHPRPFTEITSPSLRSETSSEKQGKDGRGLRIEKKKSIKEIMREIAQKRSAKSGSDKNILEPALSAARLKKEKEGLNGQTR